MGRQTRERATVYDGDIVDVDVMPERKEGVGRRARWGKTAEVQKYANAAYRSRYVRRLLEKNFRYGSMVLTLTYAGGEEPADVEGAKRDGVNWWRRVRRLYRKDGIEPKCFFVAARGEENGRLHLHVMITGGVKRGDLIGKWRCAHGVWSDYAEAAEWGTEDLAAYLMGQVDCEEYEHTYFRSRNMSEPEPEREGSQLKRQMDRVFTKDFCERLSKGDYTRRELHDAFPGFKVLDGFSVRYNTYNHGYFIHMRLLRVSAMGTLPDWAKTRGPEAEAAAEMEFRVRMIEEEKEKSRGR